MKKYIDRFLTILSLIAILIMGFYTCGFFILYAGHRDNDKDTMVIGGILSAINIALIILTLNYLPL